MKVLVTGASGFLGQATAAAVRDAGHEVRTFQRRPSGVPGVQDLAGTMTDDAAIARAVDGVEAVVHLAAKVSLAGDPADFARVNIEGTRSLLAAARAAGVGRFVFVSSPSVAHTGSSLVGADAGPAEPSRARGDYARTKAAAELLALDADAPDFAVVAVRPHLVWGPGDTQLVGRIVERARAGRLPLLDSGAALIDTLYIDNAATAMVAALEHVTDDGVHGNAYVVTNGEPRPVADLLAGICTASGVRPPQWHVPAAVARAAGSVVEAVWRVRPGEDEPPMTRFLAEQLSTAHWFDQRRTRSDLRWTPSVSIDEGLERLRAAAQASSAAT
ncbi:NAD-dependent epimerase/dehydratase family protein [Curtobacterium flaccumfaciens]|uniref:NAD-dependent epimerase/dehydratase family protein n=1 Tax=Curtobacterium flaccumfaciens TaxID=2035 RepID=UPI000FFF5400|nr:NAD-dependent epimerase/dehydratase family protein [Curtobacterium flaccumfaciens]MCS0644474.1 NAD-dependent epimerase/dehydratase family protein [Curtobacterium flaccumfaciens pv. flaccumfaciens]MCS6525277.1 NAD-dependent epimerase/dehydratase family protein [Curtobacterium flaccumfaciens pv. flaccumfaciens]MCS6530670.1 NAD-dependent epimerase/dehydratase family protein [Curtobacterium flaccumfaciens pv. flaccumfaciens]NUU09637.1 NAD-dependent epimerase/dehydratase family protein [Curtobact